MKSTRQLPLLFLALSVLAFPSAAAEAVSGTNSLFGFIRFVNADPAILARLGPPGNEGMHQAVLYAYTDPPNVLTVSKFIWETDPLVQPYELTVAADHEARTYHVYADVVLDGVAEEYWTALHMAAPLTSNSPPAQVDFDECVGLVELRYVDAAGRPLAVDGARVQAIETGTGRMRARLNTQPPGLTGNFLVVPSGVECELAIEVDLGTDIYLDRLTHAEQHTLTLACDEQSVITVTLPPPGALGRIVGLANLVGEMEPATEGYFELLGRPVLKARGPFSNQRYGALGPDPAPLDGTRPFALEGLLPSTPTERWRLAAELHLREGYRFEYFRTPGLGEGEFNPGVEVAAGATRDLGNTFVMTPAQLVGRITLSGPPEFGGVPSGLRSVVRAADSDADGDGIPDGVGASGIGGSYFIVTGVDELAPGASLTAMGGQATASFIGGFNPATAAFEGDYEAVVGMLDDQPGVWRYDGVNLAFYQPGTNGSPYLSQTLYIVEDAPWQGILAPGERVTNHVRYGLAEVCVRIRSVTPFFYPRLANISGGLDGSDSRGVQRRYHVGLGLADAPPYTADAAVFEAVVTCYVPEGTYSFQPAISIPDADGGVSETQLPPVELTVMEGERYCVEDCLRIVMTRPTCTTNTGFLGFADAFSCEATLTNLSIVARPAINPSVRLAYSDIRILEPVGIPRTTLRMPIQMFPEFDGFLPDHRDYYSNVVITATALDTRGRVATRQILVHYDFVPPSMACPADIVVASPDGAGVAVEYTASAVDDRPEPVVGPNCIPPSGSVFPVGTTAVSCAAKDLCHNTNTCTFQVTVQPPSTDCRLNIQLVEAASPTIRLSWDCAEATLQSAPSPTGPWTRFVGASSPYETPAGGPQVFYRLCLSGDCTGDP